MIYELHLTTAPDVDVDRWSALCRGLGIKPLVIELAEGEHARQVMMAATAEHSDEDKARDWVKALLAAFEAGGFPVLREKLEAPLDKAGWFTYPQYHEAHVKMLLDSEEADALPGIARHAGMHASRNALQADVDGLAKWYLTRRAYGVPFREAADQFGEAFRAVHECLPGVRMEMETVLSDSNPLLDAGWAAP